MNKLHLPNVTLCALGSEKYQEQQQQALDKSCEGITFGVVKNIIYPCYSIDEWNKAIVFELGSFIETDFALLIHPDGYVVHPECWRDEFLNYDFIGAPFPLPKDKFSYRDMHGVLQRVGNSVSIRSKKLLDIPKKHNFIWKPFHGFYNEDGYVSVNMRHKFEALGCTFAPLELARFFSREEEMPENDAIEKTFCFHKFKGKNKKYQNFEK